MGESIEGYPLPTPNEFYGLYLGLMRRCRGLDKCISKQQLDPELCDSDSMIGFSSSKQTFLTQLAL